jgi:hypothetical protein
MKTSNPLKLTLVTGCLLTLTARASILNSPHDFHSRSWNNDPADPATVCSVCHTPHHADHNSGPLWGHTAISATGWKMYSQAYSPGYHMAGNYIAPTAPAPSSLACLSCHDGSIAVNAYGGAVGTEFVTNGAAISEGSKDLTHSHPISFNYQSLVGTGPTQDKWIYDSASPVLAPDANSPGFIAGNDMTIKGFLLDGSGNVECNSCHDVHNQEGSPYSIVNNPKLVKLNGTQAGVGSILCRSCHNK